MLRFASSLTVAIFIASAASATPQPNPAIQVSATGEPKVCKHVVSAEKGAKPYELCLTKAEWEAKKRADAKNPNRMVCRYEEAPGTRFKSNKICMTAAEWENQRQLERQQIDHIQRSTCVGGAGC